MFLIHCIAITLTKKGITAIIADIPDEFTSSAGSLLALVCGFCDGSGRVDALVIMGSQLCCRDDFTLRIELLKLFVRKYRFLVCDMLAEAADSDCER